MDGYLKIKTRADTADLQKNLTQAKRELERFKKEAEKLNNKKLEIEAKLNLDDAEYRRKMDDIERKRKIELQANTNSWGMIDSSKEKKINAKYDSKQASLDMTSLKNIDKAEFQLKKIADALKINNEKQDEWNKKIDDTEKKINKINLKDVDDGFKNVGNSLASTIKKVGKWALAVFGVRSAYNAVRSAASTLSQYNDQIGTDLDYIRYAMASALQPIVETLINLVFKLLSYVNMVASAWFGVNLFAKASSKNFNNANRNAKKMQKTLSQFNFDEINKLEDNSEAGGDSSISTPSVDLSAMNDTPVPGWLQWIIDNGDFVKLIIEGIAGAFLAVKFNLDLIQGIGLFIIIDNVVNLIRDCIKLIEEPSWENFGKVLEDIGLIIVGLGLLLGKWKLGLVGLAIFIVGLVIENWDKIAEVLGKIGSWVWNNVLHPIIEFFGACFDTIWSVIKAFISIVNGIFTTLINIITTPFIIAYETVVGVFNGIRTIIEGVFNVIKGLFTGDWKLVMSGFKQIFKGVFDSLWSIAKAPLNLIIGGINSLIKGANKISFDVPDWVPIFGGKKFGFNIPELKKLKTGGIIDVPKTGVPLASNVIGGEAGAEGVLPLTNPETMSTLGQEIGKWITLNIDLTSKIDMRILCREIIRYMNENNFSRNGG